MRKLHLILDGDSWTFGSEILDPSLIEKHPNTHPTSNDWKVENDLYRKSNIFGSHLGEMIGAKRITNLAWPADDNLTILRRTMAFITNNYIKKKIPLEDVFVIVGWTTPERTHFWFKDEFQNFEGVFRLRPILDGNFSTKSQEDFWKMYVQYVWNPEQYLIDYLYIVYQFQLFCEVHKIKWLCFNAFYQIPDYDIHEWKDIDYREEISNQKRSQIKYQVIEQNRHSQNYQYENLWDMIDSTRFYKKEHRDNSFKSFCSKNSKIPFNGYHPSELSHKLWADELYNYIEHHGLL